jgi:hypothetical protein
MKDKLFRRIAAILIALCMLGTVALVGYTIHLRTECSIISYIANESW